MRIRVSDDKQLVKDIRNKLQYNKEIYGSAFCPCVLPSLYKSENKEDYICMCKEFREQPYGECHCGLYIKEQD